MRASQNISRSNSMTPSRNYGILCVLTFPLLKRLALQFIPVSSCAETMKPCFVVYFAGPSILYHPRHFNAVPYLANNSCSFQSPAVFRPVRQALCFSFVSLPTWVDLRLHSRRSKLYHDLCASKRNSCRVEKSTNYIQNQAFSYPQPSWLVFPTQA
jgi:hypothetical protein